MDRPLKRTLFICAGLSLLAASACGGPIKFPGFTKDDTVEDQPMIDETITDPVADPVSEDADPTPPTDTPPPLPEPEPDPVFSYLPAGSLIPGSGVGSQDSTVYAPDILFPVEEAPAYLQSMVWRLGGGILGGDQCDPSNYEYPWQDNFCEKRTSNFNTPTCPNSRVHLGQDIRVGSPEDCNTLRATDAAERKLHRVIAVEDGVISSIGRYTVTLRSGPRIYRYMHLNMAALEVEAGELVEAGDPIGFVSNDFGGTPTTFHLHFEIRQNLPGTAWAFVPPYRSLVAAYERREEGPGEELEPNVQAASSSAILPPPDFEIIE